MSVTDAGHHVEDIIALLENAPDTDWTPTTPNIREYWADAQSERGPGADQPAVCYVWSPTDTTLERFSIDEDKFREGNTVEVQIWSLDETEVRQLQTDVARILGQYLDDNAVATPYSTVEPTTLMDFREQKPARTTDHYIMAVEIETDGLRDV